MEVVYKFIYLRCIKNKQTMKPITKAQEKRERQAKEAISFILGKQLSSFYEMYLGSYVEYRTSLLDADIKRYSEKGGIGVAHLVAKRERKFSSQLEYLNEANKSYSNKFNGLVDTLVEVGIMAHPLRVERIQGGTATDFEFIVSHNDIVVHARVIFACGLINAPHYRFIITKRNN